jgi:small subunit ribosomal protein S14
MAKKSMLEREKKRKKLVLKYIGKRKTILKELKKAESLEEIFELSKKLQKLPRNSAPIRKRNRCWKTGRPRGFFRYFGLCRNALRELSHDCFLPGVIKASW